MSPSHTLPLRFRRTPALSFAPGRNPGSATHGMRPSIDSHTCTQRLEEDQAERPDHLQLPKP